MVQFGEHIARQLTARYLAVMAIVGLIALGALGHLGHALGDVAARINARQDSDRRQGLEAYAALAATRLAVSADGAEQAALRAGLLRTLDALKAMPGTAVFVARGRAVAGRAPLRPDDGDLLVLQRLAGPPPPLLPRDTFAQPLAIQAVAVTVILLLLAFAAWGVFLPLVERIRAGIAESERAARSLRESEQRLWRILEECPVGVSVSRRGDGAVVFANTRFCEILLTDRDAVVGGQARNHFVDDTQRRQVIAALKAEGRIDDHEVEFRRRDGSPFASLLTIRPTRFHGEEVNLAWVYDISKLKAAEERLRLTAQVVDTASEAVVITDSANRIQFVNPAFGVITEYAPEEVLGQDPSILSSGRHDGDFYRAMWRTLRETGRWRGEIWNRRKSGEFFAEQLSIVAIKDAAGATTHHIAVFSDITHRKEDEERVWRQANYDLLTGLPNRSLFVDRLSQAVRQSRREERPFALMFLDLDGFKRVNDTLGHAAGDLLLQQTAERLTQCVRASDTVARLAGDELTIIMQGLGDREDAARLASKILDSLSPPFDLDGSRAEVRGSIGVALFPDDAAEGPALLELADRAMYSVKRHGKNAYEFAAAPLLTP